MNITEVASKGGKARWSKINKKKRSTMMSQLSLLRWNKAKKKDKKAVL